MINMKNHIAFSGRGRETAKILIPRNAEVIEDFQFNAGRATLYHSNRWGKSKRERWWLELVFESNPVPIRATTTLRKIADAWLTDLTT
jgi:hypothetical protein